MCLSVPAQVLVFYSCGWARGEASRPRVQYVYMKNLRLRALSALTLAFLPLVTFAQLSLDPSSDGIAEGFLKFIYLINYYFIPLLFAIALVAFLWNMFRFAIASGDEKSRNKAKQQMIYGIAALVFIVSFWGIINLVTNGLGLGQNEAPCNDFFSDYALILTGDCR